MQRSEGYCSFVCVCVPVKSHLTSRMSNQALKEHAYLVAYERQKICEDLPETTALKSYVAKYERELRAPHNTATMQGVANFCACALA